MDFQVLLSKWMKEKNMSVYKLSALSGVPKSTIFNYKKGVCPTLDKAECLLKALGVRASIGEIGQGCSYCTNENRPAWDLDCVNCTDWHYRFCPICGKPLTDEAVQMVMEKINNMEEMTNEH